MVFLIFSAGFKMLKKAKKDPFRITVMAITFACMVLLSLFAIRFSSVFYILIFGAVGLMLYAIRHFRCKREEMP